MDSPSLPIAPRPFFSRFRGDCAQPRSPEQKRAIVRSRRVSSAALIVFFALSQMLQFMKLGPLRTTIGVIAGLAFCAVIASSGQLVWISSDEFRRHLLAKSFFAATILTFLFASLWGFAELFSHGTVPHIPLLILPVMLIFLTAAAKVVIFRQHRAPRD